MVKTTRIFLIIGMIFTFYLIFPLILGIISLKKLNNSDSVEEIRSWGIITLLFVNIVAGILMLNIREEDLEFERRTNYNSDDYDDYDDYDGETSESDNIEIDEYVENINGLLNLLEDEIGNNKRSFMISPPIKVLISMLIMDYGSLSLNEIDEGTNESLFLINTYLVFFNKTINQQATIDNIKELSSNIKNEIEKIKTA